MKQSCYAFADDNVASNLNSIQFLASLANKFPTDVKRKWVEASLRIMGEFGRLPSFRDLTEFTEALAKVANLVFGLKLFSLVGSEKSSGVPKKTKMSTFSTSTSTVLKSDTAENKRFQAKCLHCSGLHYVYRCKQFWALSFAEKCEQVKRLGLCRLCLNPGHIASKCASG